jgi:hypothetical protein
MCIELGRTAGLPREESAFQAYRFIVISTSANANPAIKKIKTSSPQINKVACRSCLGVGCVMPKKLINP